MGMNNIYSFIYFGAAKEKAKRTRRMERLVQRHLRELRRIKREKAITDDDIDNWIRYLEEGLK